MRIKNILCIFFAVSLITAGFPLWGQNNFSARIDVYEGVSNPKNSEAEALLDARNNAYRNLAASFSLFVTGRYKIEQAVKGMNLDNMEIIITGESNVTIRMHLTGIEELESKVEKTEEGYIARVFITLTEEGRKSAENYIEQETAAFRAYNYFSQKFNFPPAAFTDVPMGYSDFSAWLINNCHIFMMTEGEYDFIIQIETFLQKFNKNITVFSERLAGKPVRIIYNSPDYYDIVNFLQKMNIRVSRENGYVLLTPEISLNEFKTRIQEMPDARIIAIAGISTNGSQYMPILSEALNEIARIAGNNYSLQTQILRIPNHYLNNTYRDTEIINMLNRTARYTILLKSEIIPGIPIPQYGIPAYNWVLYHCILHDSISGKSIYSDSIKGGINFSDTQNRRIPSDLIEIINNLLENL